MQDEQVDRDLDAMTGDPVLTRQLKASLQKLRDGVGGPALAEIAREVLEGRTTLRDVARSSAYANEMSAVMARLQQWNADLTDEQREQLVADARTTESTPDA
jgi:hypothetical protein